MPHINPLELQRQLAVLRTINARLGFHAPADKAGYFLGDGLPNPNGSLRSVWLQHALEELQRLLNQPQHFYSSASAINPLVPTSLEAAATSITLAWVRTLQPHATLPSFLQQQASALVLNIPFEGPHLEVLTTAYNEWIALNFLPNEFFSALQYYSKVALFNLQVEQELT